MSIDNFTTIDSTNTRHYFVRDISKYRTIFFAKASRSQSHCGLASNKMVDLLRRFSNKIINCKPDVLRGKECGSENLNYIVVGMTPDYLLKSLIAGLRVRAFKYSVINNYE